MTTFQTKSSKFSLLKLFFASSISGALSVTLSFATNVSLSPIIGADSAFSSRACALLFFISAGISDKMVFLIACN